MDSQSSKELVPIGPRPVKTDSLVLDLKHRLTKKESLFVDKFLEGNSPHKAAILAGYSPFTAEVASSLILNRPKVLAEIRKRSDETFKEKKIDKDWVLQRAAELADANMLDYLDIRDDGFVSVDLRRVSRSMGAAIQELSYDAAGKLKIRLVDKKGAVELLARISKMFDDHEGSGRVDTPLTIQALDQIVQNITVNQQVNVIQTPVRQQLPGVVLDSQ